MSDPSPAGTEATRTPPSHRGLGVLGHLLTVGLLVVGFLLLNTSPRFETSVEERDGQDVQRLDVTVRCHSVLSGGPSGQQADLAADEVEEYEVDEQAGVLAECSRLRDQAIGRAVLLGTAGVLWAIAVTAALGWAALRRQASVVARAV